MESDQKSRPDRRTRKNGEGQGIQVLARAANILRALKDDTSGLSLGKIAQRVGLPRSTVQRIVNALVAEDFVSAGRNSTGYKIGPEILALAQAGRQDVPRSLHPIMEELSRETGETVDLALFKNDQIVFVDQVAGTQRLRAVSAIGETFPTTVTANGKAALTWLEGADVTRILDYERKQMITDKSANEFAAELDQIRKSGYALDVDEHTDGISAVGIAFHASDTIYAISIPAPSHRFRNQREIYIAKLQAIKSEVVATIPGAMIAVPRST
jgi:DNA-binding IclR family transcriptional regulator